MKKCPYCGEFIQGAAVVCRFCGRELPKENIQANSSLAESIGYNAGKLIAHYGLAKILLVIMFLWIVLYAVFKGISGIQHDTTTKRQSNTSITAPAATIPSPAPKEKYNPIAKYGKENVDAANMVMDLVKQDCKVFVDDGLVVEMIRYINDKNDLFGYVKAIADADAVLFGSARSIFVYDPSKKLIASADAFRGIRLRD